MQIDKYTSTYSSNKIRKTQNKHLIITMRRNLPKALDLLILSIYSLNFSVKNISQTVKELIFVNFY